ncbi:MAG: O-antigen ligase family protein [Anaerolineae bacterium]|nr:O-antigen ligase family protein [Anaerolineae bacterium]
MLTNIHKRVSNLFLHLARGSFAILLILLPFRLRLVAQARPVLGVYGDYTDFLFYAMDAAQVLVLLFWLCSLFLDKRNISFGHISIALPLFGLLTAALFSWISSLDTALSFYHLLRLVALFALYLFIVNEIQTPVWFALPLGIQVFLQSVIAIGQSLAQRDLGVWWLGEYSLDPNAPFMSILEVDGVRFLRAYGLSDHPNILGGCLAFGMLALLCVIVARDSEKWLRIFATIAVILASAALLVTYSRSAWAALAVGSFFLFCVTVLQRNPQGFWRGAFLTLACALVLVPFIQNNRDYIAARFDVDDSFAKNRVERGAVVERLYLYDQAHKIFAQNSLTGIGLGASVIAMQAYYPVFRMSYQPPHVSILAAAMETGIPGAVFYVAAMILPFYCVLRNRRYLQDDGIVMGLVLILAVMVIGLFDHYPWMLVPGRLMHWLSWGAFAAALERFEAKNS